MTDDVLKAAIATIMILWLVFWVPVWLLAMAYAGQFMLLPDLPYGAEFWAYVTADFLPPIVSGVLAYILIKRRRQNRHAAD